MILWNEKTSEQDIEQKIKELKQKFRARDIKLGIICTKANDFFKIIEQLQTVFERTIETTQQFRTNRNGAIFFNFFRKISEFYNAIFDEVYRLKQTLQWSGIFAFLHFCTDWPQGRDGISCISPVLSSRRNQISKSRP